MNSHGAGYGWVFYLGDGRANVGAGVSTAALARTGRNLKDFFDRFLEDPQLASWLENATPEGPPTSWSLKMGMWGAKRYGQGLMMVGDAGSMVHPISGEESVMRWSQAGWPPRGPTRPTQGKIFRPRSYPATNASSGTGGPASISRDTRWSI